MRLPHLGAEEEEIPLRIGYALSLVIPSAARNLHLCGYRAWVLRKRRFL
jgi:hypothetical protein